MNKPGRALKKSPTFRSEDAFMCHLIGSAVAAIWLVSAVAAAQTPAAPVPRTRVVMLGTGTPTADPHRFGPATVILVDSTAYLVDAGVGVVRRWAAALRNGAAPGLNAWDLKTAFITHLHSDHTLGYAELILTPWTLEPRPRRPLVAYGPQGLQTMTDHVLAAYAADIRIRTDSGGEGAGARPPHVDVHEIEPGIIYRDSRVTPQSAVASQCRRCDILIHEGGYVGGGTPYQRSIHTSVEELAAVANQSRPKLLVLYHEVSGQETRRLAALRALYDGPAVIAKDLDVIK